MIKLLRRRIFAIRYPYDDAILQRRAASLLVMNLFVMIVSLFWAISNSLRYPDPLAALSGSAVNYLVPIFCAAIYVLIQRGSLQVASWMFISIFFLAIPASIANGLYTSLVAILVLPTVAAGALLSRRAILLTVCITLVLIAAAAYAQSLNTRPVNFIPAERVTSDLLVTFTVTALTAFFLYTFNGFTQLVAIATQENLRDMRRVANFGATLDDKDESAVLAASINFVRDQLKYSFAQLFLVGAEGTLNRRMRTGFGVNVTGGESDTVIVGEASAVGEAYRTRKPVTVSLEDAPLRRSHFLPGTFDAVALPIIYRDTLIGVLDVQSASQERFTEEEIRVLGALVDTVAAAIANMRMVTSLRSSVQQQEAENVVLRARVQELRQIERQTGNTWATYFQNRGSKGMGFDFDGSRGTLIPSSDLPEALRSVVEGGAHMVRQEGDTKVVSVPINLRGEILGAMSFTLPKDRVVTDKQLETARIVAERLALALENRRLFEQTQAAAARERKASEATNLLISATDVESVMNVAVKSFNEALGAIQTRIHLQPSAVIEPERSEETSVL